MPGMQTQVHLIANTPGDYPGMSSAFSGPGFSDMHFDTIATSRAEFDNWIAQAKKSPLTLNQATYQTLEQPSSKNPVAVYAGVDPGLFNGVINQYMHMPDHGASGMTMDQMNMQPTHQPAE
jgi:cytochrome o ubiquinol oxidase subunit II